MNTRLAARTRVRAALFLAAVALALSGRAEPPPAPPRPGKYVTDLADAIPADRASALNEKLAGFERETSSQVLVYVDRKVPEGTTLEEFANRAFHAWGVGQKGKSNGVVFFLFTDERRMRMEVGYGLEGALPDARAHRIDSEIIAPLLKVGNVAGALDAGTDAILAAARGEPYKGTGRTAAESRRSAPERNAVLYSLFQFFWIGGLAIIAALLLRASWRSRDRSRGFWGWASSSGSSSSSSSSDSSSSSSDFSGGGGDSGGGGSSDSY
jgi:uncharacterized protein